MPCVRILSWMFAVPCCSVLARTINVVQFSSYFLLCDHRSHVNSHSEVRWHMGYLDHLSLLPHDWQKLASVFTEAPHDGQNIISEVPTAYGAKYGGAALFGLRCNRTTSTTTIATTTTTAMTKAHSNKEFDWVVEINCSDVTVETETELRLKQNSER